MRMLGCGPCMDDSLHKNLLSIDFRDRGFTDSQISLHLAFGFLNNLHFIKVTDLLPPSHPVQTCYNVVTQNGFLVLL